VFAVVLTSDYIWNYTSYKIFISDGWTKDKLIVLRLAHFRRINNFQSCTRTIPPSRMSPYILTIVRGHAAMIDTDYPSQGRCLIDSQIVCLNVYDKDILYLLRRFEFFGNTCHAISKYVAYILLENIYLTVVVNNNYYRSKIFFCYSPFLFIFYAYNQSGYPITAQCFFQEIAIRIDHEIRKYRVLLVRESEITKNGNHKLRNTDCIFFPL
jgi:hypothetical protein